MKVKTLRELQLVEGFDEHFAEGKLIKEGASGLADILNNKWVAFEDVQELVKENDELEQYKEKYVDLCYETTFLHSDLEEAKQVIEKTLEEAKKYPQPQDMKTRITLDFNEYQKLCHALSISGKEKMIIYCLEFNDFDLHGEEGYYKDRAKAEKRMEELKADPDYLWGEYLEVREKELIE